MEKRRRIVLYGGSLVLAGVGKSLEKYSRLEVVHLETVGALDPAALAALDPDALLLDLGAVGSEVALRLAGGRPELLVIGLDAAGERLLVLSGHQARALTTADLVKLIDSGGRLAGRANRKGKSTPEAAPGSLMA